MTRRFLALLAAVPLALAACRSSEQKLLDRRRELRATLDELYAEYRRSAEESLRQGADAGVLGHVAGEMERAYFENQCLALGRGERGIGISARMDAFLLEERNARACREAADLQVEVNALERQVSAERS